MLSHKVSKGPTYIWDYLRLILIEMAASDGVCVCVGCVCVCVGVGVCVLLDGTQEPWFAPLKPSPVLNPKSLVLSFPPSTHS